MSRSIWAVLLIVACGGDGGGTGPAATASLTGVVREAVTNTPIANATVAVGSSTIITGPDGSYSFQNVPIGSAITVAVTAPGFESYTQTIAVQSGVNSHAVSLTRQTFYEFADKLLYLTPGITRYRGVLLDLPGSTADSRGWIRGDFSDPRPGWGDIREYRRRALLFAEQHQLAIMGTNTFPAGSSADPTTMDEMIPALQGLATRTGHPELATAPLLLFGHSLGGCVAYNFTRLHAERVIGLVSQKGPCHAWIVDGGAATVPAYFVVGVNDPQNSIGNITELFERGRAVGAPWTVIVIPEEDHARTNQLDLLFNWLNTVVQLRLPPALTSGPLRPIDVPAGWLASRSTGAIARYSCYPADKLLANWFPTEQSARDWHGVAMNGSASVTTC